MTLHRIKAVAIGLLGGRRANEWVVTKKLGDVPKTKPTAQRLPVSETSRKDLHVALLPVTVKPSKKKEWTGSGKGRISLHRLPEYVSSPCSFFLLLCGQIERSRACLGRLVHLLRLLRHFRLQDRLHSVRTDPGLRVLADGLRVHRR